MFICKIRYYICLLYVFQSFMILLVGGGLNVIVETTYRLDKTVDGDDACITFDRSVTFLDTFPVQ